jgi:pyruvate kinase
MLSAETAAGRYPREAVATMDRILRLVEGYQWKHGKYGLVPERAPSGGIDTLAAMARATALLSRDVPVRSVVVPTHHGGIVRQLAAKRPAAPIIAVSADERVCRRLALHWGVASVLAPADRQADLPGLARDVVRRLGLAEIGQPILLVWDTDPAHTGAAPSVSLLSV